MKYSGVFERLGFKDEPGSVVLLKDVRDENGEIFRDHIWLPIYRLPTFDTKNPGLKIEFEAEVENYQKGYKGENWEITMDHPIGKGKTLDTNVFNIDEIKKLWNFSPEKSDFKFGKITNHKFSLKKIVQKRKCEEYNLTEIKKGDNDFSAQILKFPQLEECFLVKLKHVDYGVIDIKNLGYEIIPLKTKFNLKLFFWNE